MPDPFVHRLEQLVGADHVLVGEDTRPYTTDWTGRWEGECTCVVRPATTDEVAAVMRACAEAGFAVVPQGGNTGLVGGAVPHDGAVLVSTRRLDRVDDVEEDTGRVVVGAGATLQAVQEAAAAAGWVVGVDLASRGSATVGGMVATDAGGARVVARGSMGTHVLGLEVVLADGRTQWSWDDDTTTDMDLRTALIGSEGTLGVITAVLLQLARPAPTTATLLLQSTGARLGGLVEDVRSTVAGSDARLTACELLTRAGAALVAEATGTTSPVRAPVALLVDLAGEVDDDLLAALAALTDQPTVLGVDRQDRRRLWRLRERHTEAIATLGVPVKLDVRVPVDRLADLVAAAPAVVASVTPAARCVLFGHAAEGNVHVNVVGAADVARQVEDAVYDLVAGLGGRVDAEHGIGRAKVGHLHRTTPDEELARMRAVKDALDPDGRCNPGVRVPAEVG